MPRNMEQVEKHQRIKIINLVLTPVENQSPGRYVELLNEMYENKIEVNTYSDKFTRIKTLYGLGTDIIHGEFVNYTRLNPDLPAFNTQTNEMQAIDYDPTIGPNAKSANFYFIPQVHKLVLHFPMKFSENHIITFLKNALPQVAAEGEAVNINVVISRDAIERIIYAESVSRLCINISYSNNDNNTGWANIINEQLQSSHVQEAETIYKSERRGNIVITEDCLIKGQLDLTETNGFAEAVVIENGRPQKINTLDHPLIEKVQYVDDILPEIKNKMISMYGRHDEDIN